MSGPTDLAERVGAVNDALMNSGQTGVVPDFFAPGYVVHLANRDFEGHASVTAFVDQLRSAFPDLEVEIDVLVCNDDRVAWRGVDGIGGLSRGRSVGSPLRASGSSGRTGREPV